MITAQELRIGNYVKSPYSDFDEVTPYDIEIAERYENHELKPIHLTEEILLNNCGMVKSKWSKTRLDFDDDVDGRSQFHIDVLNDRFIFRGLGMSIVYVDTLHHLQNLVYAVKQKELNITL